MIDIFNKYDFSVESFLNDQSSNLIIFSSWPKDFLKISSVNKLDFKLLNGQHAAINDQSKSQR